MAKTNYTYNFLSGLHNRATPYDFNDKAQCVNNIVGYMLCRTQEMFKYENLPETISKRNLELLIQNNGFACIAKADNNKLYAFYGGLGGEPDPYYMPTKCIVANASLKLSKEYTINEDCVIIPNDCLYMGLMPMLSRYATAMTENEITTRIADINSRIISIITAPTDSLKASADLFIQKIEDGKLSAILSDDAFAQGINSLPFTVAGATGAITNLIEYQQYLKASLYNELGLDANYNMKRESLNSSESQMNKDALLPLCDNMLECRKDAVEKINKMFELEISVDFSSAWKDNIEELEIAHEEISARAEISEESEETENEETE